MQEIPFWLVDAFSNRNFGGNVAAVCALKEWLPDSVMLQIAQEHNLSETAFFVPSKGGFELRWFATTTEVSMCGHGTLATAHVIFNHLDYPDARLRFDTLSGQLTVTREGEWLTLDFPAGKTSEQTPPPALLNALGLEGYVAARKGRAWLIEVESQEQLAALKPDIHAMTPGEHKVTVTARGDGPWDFVSRFFVPGEALWEDPVTGSAHTMLIPYWADKLGKTSLFARQISARGGDLRCELKGDRVLMSGTAVTWVAGTAYLR